MKCPLMHWVKVTTHGASSSDCMDCLQGECAWRLNYRVSKDKEIDCCSITAIALALLLILDKMPHEVQFRK